MREYLEQLLFVLAMRRSCVPPPNSTNEGHAMKIVGAGRAGLEVAAT